MGGKALGIAGGAAKWATAGASAIASYGVYDMFKQAGQFEQYRIAFKVAEGSAEKAKAKMDWISKFAADTPYELNDVIEAFRNLQSVAGVDPTDGSLSIVGDAAAGLSKDLMQVAEAYSDAVGGEFERLLDLGLRASKQGDQVTFKYRKNGKAITKSVKNDALEIKRALESIWKDQFAGSTIAQSKSLFGIISNIKDAWARFLVMVADAGVFDAVKSDLESMLDTINGWANDGTMKAWAKEISDNLKAVWEWGTKFYKETNWKQVGEDICTVASAITDAAGAMAELARWSGRVYPIYQKFSPLHGGLLGSLFSGSPEPSANVSRGAARPGQNDRLWNNATPGKSLITRPPAGRASGWTRLPAAGAKTSDAAPVQVSGTTRIEVALTGPLSGKVASVKSANPRVPINVKVGKMMGGQA